jgi:hypothetical protein
MDTIEPAPYNCRTAAELLMSGSTICLIGAGVLVVSVLALSVRSGQLTAESRPPTLAFLGVLVGAPAVIAGPARMIGH